MGTEHPPDLTLYALPFFFALMVAELVVLRRRRRRIDRRDFWASLGMGLGSLLTINLVMGIVGGPLERVFNSASHHRVHHGSNPQYLDKNYGGILIVWDRLFGTYEPEVEPVRYGLTKNIDSYNLFTIAFHEWRALGRDLRATPRWSDRVRRLSKGPGWEPEPTVRPAS